MTDPDLLARRLGIIETCIREIRELGAPARVHVDVRERRFLEHTLQIAIQSALDVASHIVSSERLGEPRTNAALFDTLAEAGWVDEQLGATLRRIAGFRNVLVHGYADVDPEIVADVATHRLDDLQQFVDAVRLRLGRDAH